MSTPILAHDTVQTPPDAIYVGLDLSLTSTGLAIIHNGTATVRRIKSKAKKDATTEDQSERLDALIGDIIGAIPASDRTLIAVEGPSFGSSGSAAHILGGLWWLVRHALRIEGFDVVVASPSTVKKYATGSGNASKDQVLAAVVRRYLDVEVTGNDEADALVLAAIRARHDGAPFEILPLPAAQAAAVNSVTR